MIVTIESNDIESKKPVERYVLPEDYKQFAQNYPALELYENYTDENQIIANVSLMMYRWGWWNLPFIINVELFERHRLLHHIALTEQFAREYIAKNKHLEKPEIEKIDLFSISEELHAFLLPFIKHRTVSIHDISERKA
jgi:hypothetical protein